MSRTVVVAPRGELATVDTSAAVRLMAHLLDPAPTVRSAARAEVLDAPHRQMPPVLFALSENLVADGEMAEAAR